TINLNTRIKGDSNKKIVEFLDTVHRLIYDNLIFVVGDRDIQIALIDTFRNKLEKEVKKALLLQADYILENENIELWNGVVRAVGGVDIKPVNDIMARIVSPSAINLLSNTRPNILYAGE
ncbi:MAG: hypothetical protein FWC68_06415, partial [Oscillospiraceae bacterium]|nr:hypothetical protein [Oscillospiraceae bacterium]